MRILYFAYGSNMSSERLRRRVRSAAPVGPAFLKDTRLLFNKASLDGSGKANLVESPGDVTWGVLYEVDSQDIAALDRAEAGYERATVRVWKQGGAAVQAEIYVSTHLTDDPRACEWYKQIVLVGAREHRLPSDYITYLEGLPAKPRQDHSEAAG